MLTPVLTLALIAASLLPIQDMTPGTSDHPQEETPTTVDVPDGNLFLGTSRDAVTDGSTTSLVVSVRMVSIVDKKIARPRDIDIDVVRSVFPDPAAVTVIDMPDSVGVILRGGDLDFDKLRDLAKPKLEVIDGGKKPKAAKAPKSTPAPAPAATTPVSTSTSMAAVTPVPKPGKASKKS